MTETENTAIVLHYTNYKDSDRMITLFSPQKGRLEANCRGCRKPKSPLLNAADAMPQTIILNPHGEVTYNAQAPLTLEKLEVLYQQALETTF